MKTTVQQDRLASVRLRTAARLDNLSRLVPQAGGDVARYLRDAAPVMQADPGFREQVRVALEERYRRKRVFDMEADNG
jgi:hypothetical protein